MVDVWGPDVRQIPARISSIPLAKQPSSKQFSSERKEDGEGRKKERDERKKDERERKRERGEEEKEGERNLRWATWCGVRGTINAVTSLTVRPIAR